MLRVKRSDFTEAGWMRHKQVQRKKYFELYRRRHPEQLRRNQKRSNAKRYRLQKEMILARNREWVTRNRKRVNELSRINYRKNPERCKLNQRRWILRHLEKAKLTSRLSAKKARDLLSSTYILGIIVRGTPLLRAQIPGSLVNIYARNMQLKRLLKQEE